MTDISLNILDQCPLVEGGSAGESLRNMMDLAVLADELGYSRFWIAEHHGSASKACTSPEVLLGSLAGATSRLRVGSGGCLLQHYSAFKVFENFATLSHLYPGRIDLGIGRAAGGNDAMKKALQPCRCGHAPEPFQEKLAELLRHFGDSAVPLQDRPEVWLLGSSARSARQAMEVGIRYAFADFLLPDVADSVHDAEAEAPFTVDAVAVWALCAETLEEAERLASSARMMNSAMFQHRRIAVPKPATALQFFESGSPLTAPAGGGHRMVAGTPDTVLDRLLAIASRYGAREVFVLNSTHDHGARRRSYELLWNAFAARTAGHGTMNPAT